MAAPTAWLSPSPAESRRAGGCVAFLLIVLTFVPSLLMAEEQAEARAEAKLFLDKGDDHLRRGSQMRQRGNSERAIEAFELALEAYQSAFDAFPEARIYFPIARAEESLGRFLDAHRHYQLVLEEGDELPDRLRAEVERRIEVVRERIGGLWLQIEPADARVAIDGEPAGRGPFVEPIFVHPGARALEISAEGHRARRLDFEVAEGEGVRIVVALQPISSLAGTGDDPAPDRPGDRVERSASKAPLVAGISLTAGLGLAATATGLFAVSQHGTFTDRAAPADERQAARETGQIFAVTTDVLMIVTAAAAGYTAYYYYRVYRRSGGTLGAAADADERAASRSIWLSPYAADEGGGVALEGRF